MSQSLFGEFQPIAAIATTPVAAQKLQSLCQTTGAILWVPESLKDLKNVQVYQGSLKNHIASLWQSHRALIFGLATGAVVRLIAPLLVDKYGDPAVIVIDEQGKFVISLCSGHQGKAEKLTQAIAVYLGGTPILTGAAAGLGLPGVDMLGIPFGWQRGDGDWTGVSAAVARGESVEVIQEAGSILWQNYLPQGHSFKWDFLAADGITDVATDGITDVTDGITDVAMDGVVDDKEGILPGQEFPLPTPDCPGAARIWISPRQRRFSGESDLPQVQWHPRVLWVGIGCERGTSRELIEAAIEETCGRFDLSEKAIAGIATIDIKGDEVGLVQLCRDRNLPLRTFSPEILRSVTVPTPSDIVAAEVGTPSVAEASAIYASLNPITFHSPSEKTATPSAPTSPTILVPKQIFKSVGQPGGVTVAIAQSKLEYIGRTGELFLVGTGPGNLDQMTLAAKMAISQADAVIGYSLYIDLITPIFRPGQIIESLPITQERQRAIRGIELAQWGLTVAVISSGDCGIYGMAGLVLEELKAGGWDGKTPAVQVFPGITALQAAASRVGAPLMHDFCAISLSDLLTPWEVIEKRLEAAAKADFVTTLYNPKSRTRTEQIAIAQRIFLQYRHPDTPVAIVRCAYREDEEITLTTLDKFTDLPIDMLTAVLIGNQSTSIHGDWMITPRGYLGNGE